MVIGGLAPILALAWVSMGSADPSKVRILVVSSYHREYSWSQDTNAGLCDAMLKVGYFDSRDQAAEYTKHDAVESSRAIVKKLWMDTKRKSSKSDMADAAARITEQAKAFHPDLILLGDDNAANYIGNQFLDTAIPIVFWGVNNTPVKYGLVDDPDKPGHNVTGVYQSGYYKESLDLLKVLAPGAKTFAILSDDTETGRSHLKAIEALSREGVLPLQLVDAVATNDFTLWQQRALELQDKVDAFYIAQYAALKDAEGRYVPAEAVARWYLTHLRIPEATDMVQFVKQGILCGADDSGYNQGYEAVMIAHDIVANGAKPSTYPTRAPKRGHLMVNRERAQMLGITLTDQMGIEEYLDHAQVLEDSAPAAH